MSRQRRLPFEDPEIIRLMRLRDEAISRGDFGRASTYGARIYKARHSALWVRFGRKTKRRKRAA